MIGVVIATLVIVIFGQLVTWFLLFEAWRRMESSMFRLTDRLRKRREHEASEDDTEVIGNLMDDIVSQVRGAVDEAGSDLLSRNPGARRPGDY